MTSHTLRTLGHATLVVLEEGVPLLATDPWLIGSVYWRSWWLEKYPSAADIGQVRMAKALYITHTHPDHFHLPSLRRIGKRPIIVPRFPRSTLADYLKREGYDVEVLKPWCWYALSSQVRVASVPVPIDDSIIVIDTPKATIVNLNDAMPVDALTRTIRDRLVARGKARVMLKSYAPASMAVALFREGERRPMKTKLDYVATVQRMARILGATHYVPFASQAFFSRRDSRWANEFKVVYEDLRAAWDCPAELLPPFISLDLETLDHSTEYGGVKRELDAGGAARVREQEVEEAAFVLSPGFDEKLKKYLDHVRFLRFFLRHGIGWRLTSSGQERYYCSAGRRLERKIPQDYDLVIELPDKVLSEALDRNVMTDLGITMIIKVHTQVSNRIAYGAFLLMGLHDYRHLNDLRSGARAGFFYLPYVFPALLRLRWLLGPKDRVSAPLRAAATFTPGLMTEKGGSRVP